ncbi:MAG TPA: ABC transporter permease [Candidatus Fimihabitans intestinipullorum]|uniref:Cell division protein FtsX n=1 Tax=Candidatus Fimihabitans intestinipullorum TaxID=2840820 RepID=A0A9D1HX81_9BACT|nr:ABC transporter permease [Candidatus Fimihabitans intestinipullorum]
MKVFRILGRNIRDSFKSVFRNFSLSLASISCITITLIVVAIFVILTFNVNNFTTLVEKDVTIVAFLDVDITQENIKVVEKKIADIDEVDNYTFQSKQEISEEMMASSETFKNIMKEWTEDDNPLQDTFLVKVKDINDIADVAKRIKKMDGVSIVKYGEGMVEQLISIFEVVRKICMGTVIALVLVTAFLISNTIKITIFSRRREIEIMRLVGASNINIKIPFIFEGLFLGIMGSILPIIATVYGYNLLYDNFDGQLFSPFIKLVEPEPFVLFVSLALLVIGILVGMFGSWRAVKKHLKI